jgi:hypothetical protein
MIALDQLTPANFSSLTGALFHVELAPGRTAQAELVRVTPFETSASAPRKEAFSLLFRLTGCGVLPQRTYRVRNEQFGEADVFLVPISYDQHGLQMEAVFN